MIALTIQSGRRVGNKMAHQDPENDLEIPHPIRSDEWVRHRLDAYLLSEMDETDANQVEAAVFVRPQLLDDLNDAEIRLIERYLDGSLPEVTRRAFELNFLPLNRDKVAVLSGLRKPPVASRRSTPFRVLQFPREKLLAGALAAALVAVAFLWGLERRTQNARAVLVGQMEAVRNQARAFQSENQELKERLSSTASTQADSTAGGSGPIPKPTKAQRAGGASSAPQGTVVIDGNSAMRNNLRIRLGNARIVRWVLPSSEAGSVRRYEIRFTHEDSVLEKRVFETQPGNVIDIPILDSWAAKLPLQVTALSLDSGFVVMNAVLTRN
jgi:hypothetical protein